MANVLYSNTFFPNFITDARNCRPFSICIMDEASQCVEPEALIPLKLGFTKLIMVGDPEQLPATVSSIEAKNKDFDVSLYSRVYKTFEVCPEETTPIQKLAVQYRMHSDIMTWPNQYIYGGILRQGVDRSNFQDKRFNLTNYKVLKFSKLRPIS